MPHCLAPEATIVILTGAGISAESGLSTFRDNGGLWDSHRIEDVATPEAFARDPALVQSFYNMRRADLERVQPNAAHRALAELAAQWPGDVVMITQNVDDLHARAAQMTPPQSRFRFLPMHGELRKARCRRRGDVIAWENDIAPDMACPVCGQTGCLRPHIVWFGEMPLYMDEIEESVARCDLFLSVGTSGTVYPAAGLVTQARLGGRAHTVELNMEPSHGHSMFHEAVYGPATRLVPDYVHSLINGQGTMLPLASIERD